MSNQNLNPISRLLDIDFPDIKRSNFSNSYDVTTTASPGFVQVVMSDHIMAGTRAKLDFNSASFANATIAPLYGRYKVKYLAFWAPDRLYMPDWLSGEKMKDDNYPYPYISCPSDPIYANTFQGGFFSSLTQVQQESLLASTGAEYGYVPPASLAQYLKYYPAHFHTGMLTDMPNKNAFSLLAFWDAYRTFFVNPQEEYFYVRTSAFRPEITGPYPVPATSAVDTPCSVRQLDDFFRQIKRSIFPPDVRLLFRDMLGFDPLFSKKRVYYTGADESDLGAEGNYVNHPNFHYGLPLSTYKPDMYTSFISNENVELERSSAVVNASVGDNGARFTMEQWYLASRIQSKIRKNLYKLQDFSQWIDTNFGVKPSTTLTQPMFLGAFESDILFNDVVNTSQTSDNSNYEENKNLGSRAAYGFGKNGNRSTFFDFTAKEPGTVMILQTIVPEVFYFEGQDVIHDNLNFNEEYNPIFDANGFQDLAKATLNIVPNLHYDPTGTMIRGFGSTRRDSYDDYNTAIAQQPYGMEHMGKNNILLGLMSEPSYYQSWSLARSFNYIRSAKIHRDDYPNMTDNNSYYSTYIIPEMYTNIFATSPHVDNFQFYLSFDYVKYQPVSKQFLSFD